MRIKSFIRDYWAAYAHYDNQRSLPHIMDGLKVTQRKIMFCADKLPKNAGEQKVSQFSGTTAGETSYHHGEVSMMDAVVKMAQDFPGTNNYPLLQKHGQFGTRLSSEVKGYRYIFFTLHPNWDKFFPAIDQEIVEYLFDDNGKQIEPKYFIPVVPMVLLNGADGTGNGFGTHILNYSLATVTKAIREMVKYGAVKTPMIPYVHGFNGSVSKTNRQVTFTGTLKVVHSTKIVITELPPGYDNDEYKVLLNKLVDNEFIKDYTNNSDEDKWEFVISCSRTTTALSEEVLLEKFGLVGRITENFVAWGMDETKPPMTFESPEALLAYWYDARLELYAKSIADQIKKTKALLVKLSIRIGFIEWCLKNDFRKFTKAEFIANAVAGVKRLTAEVAGELVSMPMYRITTDEVKKAEKEIDDNIDHLDALEKLTPVGLMEANVKGL